MPSYEMLPGMLLRAAENASSVVPGATDDAGEYLAMALIESIPAAMVPEASVIILPMVDPAEGEPLDFTYLASSKHLFIRVHVRPQPRMTYGQCMAYSAGTVEKLVPVGTAVKFPSVTNYLVAKPEPLISDSAPAKRVCLRPLDTGGEQADTEDKPKAESFRYAH